MTSKVTHRAPGGPGIEPRWTHGAKLAVGTAYSTSSRVWYTLDAGCVTEVYYPTIDLPLLISRGLRRGTGVQPNTRATSAKEKTMHLQSPCRRPACPL